MTLARSHPRRSSRSGKVRTAARPINPRAYGREVAISVARPLAELFIREGRSKAVRKIDWKCQVEETFLGFRLAGGPVRPMELPSEPLPYLWVQGDEGRDRIVLELQLQE